MEKQLDKQELQNMLVQIHDELEHTETLDSDSRAMLEHLMADIQDLLNREERGLPTQNHPVTRRLRQSIQMFELSHPTLTLSMGHLLDILSQSGI